MSCNLFTNTNIGAIEITVVNSLSGEEGVIAGVNSFQEMPEDNPTTITPSGDGQAYSITKRVALARNLTMELMSGSEGHKMISTMHQYHNENAQECFTLVVRDVTTEETFTYTGVTFVDEGVSSYYQFSQDDPDAIDVTLFAARRTSS